MSTQPIRRLSLDFIKNNDHFHGGVSEDVGVYVCVCLCVWININLIFSGCGEAGLKPLKK